MNKIEETLAKIFSSHRIVFWYDDNQELCGQFNEMELQGIDKILVENNQFYIKHLVCKEKPDNKFLLYFPSAKPANSDNWLLDLELANYLFQTSQEALYAQELGLDYHYTDLIAEHIDFFKNKERRALLKQMLGKDDEHRAIRYKMLAVLFDTENPTLVSFLQAHASAYNDGNARHDRELERFNLKRYYWKEISRKLGYTSDKPSIYDFLIELFNKNFSLGENQGLFKEARHLIAMWKDTISYQEAFKQLSGKIATDLQVEQTLNNATIDEVINDDLFELIDRKIISDLAELIDSENITADKLNQFIKKRENKYWYYHFQHFYAALSQAMQMISFIRKHEKHKIDNFIDGINDYTKELFKIDYAYRKFIYHYRQAKQNKVLQQLAEKVEKVYCNDWLLTFGNQWQKAVDSEENWFSVMKYTQQRFFNDHVKPVVSKGQRLFVIISDALRYECGWEYLQNIQQEKRFNGELSYMVSALPSYTQLGMAALLPNKDISIQPNTENALIDGMSTQGTISRAKILQQLSGVRATAIKAEEFTKMNSSTEGRDYVKQYDLIYIYHNQIDKTGDDKISEDKVFEAVERELEFLMDVVRKVAAMNGTNMFITSDHGFIYQNNELPESDFTVRTVSGDVWKESRRYVIGENLTGNAGTKHYTSEQLGLTGNADVLIPKSINRIRIKGSGSRYVHGGASLQEIVVPLLKVSKKRQDTTSYVEIDIIKSTDKITTNILAVSFLQTGLVNDKVLPRQIRSAIFAENGELLSDVFSYKFDITEGTERMREVKHRFHLSSKASGKFKNQRVKLLLEEPMEGSNKWKTYKEYYYTLNISFTNDFDDF